MKERLASGIKMEFEVARMEPLFATEEAYKEFLDRQGKYKVITAPFDFKEIIRWKRKSIK